MIFNNNSTVLGKSIPMAEGYDCSYGAALALVEGARNDYAMFQAMLGVESRELQIRNESAGYVTEGELSALREATGAGIWTKIKELFKKLVAKVKSIVHTFISKIDGLMKSDKELVKKYEKEVIRKSNIGKLEVKWRKTKSYTPPAFDKDITTAADSWDSEADTRFKNVCKFIGLPEAENTTELNEELMNLMFEDDSPSTYTLDEVGGIRAVINTLNNAAKDAKELDKMQKDVEKLTSKVMKEADKNAGETAKASTGENPTATQSDVEKANHIYDLSVTLQSVLLATLNTAQQGMKIDYAQNKAAFMKAIAANDKKLAESATYLDAVAEAAEEEVEDVIDGAINSVDVTNTNNASTNVLDPDVSNDPDALVYGDDPEYKKAATDGSVDSNVYSRESAIFNQMLY